VNEVHQERGEAVRASERDEARTRLERERNLWGTVDVAGVYPDALVQEELDLDSMDFLNLVTALHEETGIDVPKRDYPKLATIGGFVAYVAAAAGS